MPGYSVDPKRVRTFRPIYSSCLSRRILVFKMILLTELSFAFLANPRILEIREVL